MKKNFKNQRKVSPLASTFRFAIVVSRFNEELTSNMLERALTGFQELGVPRDHIQVAYVPGSFEIPLAAKNFALSKKVDAVLCIGVIIRGETYHFELVANTCASGIIEVGLETNIPLIFSVIATEDVLQAQARIDTAYQGAFSAIEMVATLREIRSTCA